MYSPFECVCLFVSRLGVGLFVNLLQVGGTQM